MNSFEFSVVCVCVCLCFQKPHVADLNVIFQRIRDAMYKNGIRTTEFFRDHDKLRSGVITENQVHVIRICSHYMYIEIALNFIWRCTRI